MATRRTPQTDPPPAVPPAAAASNGDASKAPAFDWSDMRAPVAMPSKVPFSGIKVDVLTTVPEPIRQRAEACLALNVLAVRKAAASTAKRPRVDYDWRIQLFATPEQAAAFGKALTRYAKYRPADKPIPHADTDSPRGQVTCRLGDVTWYTVNDDGEATAVDKGTTDALPGIRYSVRPLEQRNTTTRLPGTV